MNTTNHKIYYSNATKMKKIKNDSIDLIVTSPPYPMIEMWDSIFSKQNNKIENALKHKNDRVAFELMHEELDKVWKESFRILKNGGIACINIGNATRSINQNFALYPNHSRILNYCFNIGFNILPYIIWRKQTNAPTKFMGSGMLPVGAYVTLEHEYILILRKGKRKIFANEKIKQLRRESSFFWEERNIWFSDTWTDIKGTQQTISDKKSRNRSGAFPINLAYQLINMFSIQGDIVLDPFLGTGTTSIAAAISQRNSIGIEIDKKMKNIIENYFNGSISISKNINEKRIKNHNLFVQKRLNQKKQLKYFNKNFNFSVMTRSEVYLSFKNIKTIEKNKESFIVNYEN